MITKIKYKDGVEIHTENTAGTRVVETVFKCSDIPHPDFPAIFIKLVPVVREIIEVDDRIWLRGVTVTGVTYTYNEEHDVRGAVITAKADLENSNSPFCFNTPHLPFKQYTEHGETPLMPENGVILLTKLEEEAELYMSGQKRAQGELFAGAAK